MRKSIFSTIRLMMMVFFITTSLVLGACETDGGEEIEDGVGIEEGIGGEDGLGEGEGEGLDEED